MGSGDGRRGWSVASNGMSEEGRDPLAVPQSALPLAKLRVHGRFSVNGALFFPFLPYYFP